VRAHDNYVGDLGSGPAHACRCRSYARPDLESCSRPNLQNQLHAGCRVNLSSFIDSRSIAHMTRTITICALIPRTTHRRVHCTMMSIHHCSTVYYYDWNRQSLCLCFKKNYSQVGEIWGNFRGNTHGVFRTGGAHACYKHLHLWFYLHIHGAMHIYQ
jgi:hypothetical protein